MIICILQMMRVFGRFMTYDDAKPAYLHALPWIGTGHLCCAEVPLWPITLHDPGPGLQGLPEHLQRMEIGQRSVTVLNGSCSTVMMD